MSDMRIGNDAYTGLLERVRDVGRLRFVHELLDWDQETYMPKNGVEARAEMVALINGLAHDRLTAEETEALLESAQREGAADDDHVRRTNLRESRRVFERATRIPTELVKEIARTSSLAKGAWIQARSESDFGKFAPLLGKMIELKKEVAERIGYETEPYDALMDEFEPGARVADLEPIFTELRTATVALLERIQAASTKPDPSILRRSYPRPQQEKLSRRLAEALHFDFEAGRMDVSAHPFTTTVGGSADVRFTTRYHEDFLPASVFGTLHETGHALYEQGLPFEHVFTPAGTFVSLGIHESQSRLWENLVGRSLPLWTYHYPALKDLFPEALGQVSLEKFYKAINTVAPSLIRVEADELTYNLHIALRFEIERALLDGTLEVNDVPAAWNEKMRSLLGVTPPDDAQGCLQDVHWSMGIFGYFPTYTLGNLYAAQFLEQARKDIPDLFNHICAGDNRPLLSWLRTNIHQHGQRYRAHELVEHVTGKPLSLEPFLDYVTEKFSTIYGL